MIVSGDSTMHGEQESAAQSFPVGKLVCLLLGSLAGLGLWFASLAVGYLWRATVFGGIDAWRGPEGWQLWLCGLSMFGGLAIMFACFLPLRALERTQPALRRLIYTFNAILGGLLVVAILLVMNVLVYNYFTGSYDWTESNLYTLSDMSRKFAQSLDKNVKIYAFWPDNERKLRLDVQTLLSNWELANPEKVDHEFLSTDMSKLQFQLRDIGDQCDYNIGDRAGLLVLYGEKSGGKFVKPKTRFRFIKYEDLFDNRSPDGSRFDFKGEDKLLSAVRALVRAKKPVVYFLQGNEELDVTNVTPGKGGRGAGMLAQLLSKVYRVKGLRLSTAEQATGNADDPDPDAEPAEDPVQVPVMVGRSVPRKADVVVIAGPRSKLSDATLKALDAYMNPPAGGKKGKLVVLLGAGQTPDLKVLHTGLEKWLAKYNVKLEDNRILALPGPNNGNPLEFIAAVDPEVISELSPFSRVQFIMHDARPVMPVNPAKPVNSFGCQPIMYSKRDQLVWIETNMTTDVITIIKNYSATPEGRKQLAAKLRQGIPVGVVGLEGTRKANNSPVEYKPRLVVLGSTSLADNQILARDPGGYSAAFMTSALGWLLEDPTTGGPPPKKRSVFVLNPGEQAIKRIQWWPGMLIMLCICGLATGVWLVRRR